MKNKKFMREHVVTLVEFAGHIVAGVLLFAMIGLAALSLEVFTEWLHSMGMSDAAVKVLRVVEVGMLWLDVALMGFWVAASSFKALKDLLALNKA